MKVFVLLRLEQAGYRKWHVTNVEGVFHFQEDAQAFIDWQEKAYAYRIEEHEVKLLDEVSV